jgi:monovalent cation:H+ antiporter-2, CPA2 family
LAVISGVDFIQDLAVVMLVAGLAGWLFQRAGLSVIVGYLVAGMVIGPHSLFPLVEESQSIQILSQMGLVFLMFAIGLGLSVRRLRRLGTSIVVATILSALLVFNGWRLVGLAIGWSEVESLFLAGMLTVSSSAIIGKVLQELGFTHQKSGQMALGVTVLEDMVAIIVLTFLISYAAIGEVRGAPIFQALGLFGAFVIFLGVTGLLLVPRFLRVISRTASAELQTLLVASLLFLLALLAHQAGYSLALGAFLLGAIVAETPQKGNVERSFEGLRHLFATVFFVAIGMMIDVRDLLAMWDLVLFVSVLTMLGRFLACSFSLLLIGNTSRDAARAGLALTPVGEFSFIIAQAGILAMVLPPRFYPLAVGVSLVTSLACPVLVRHSERILGILDRMEPRIFKTGLAFYHGWLSRVNAFGEKNLFWRLSRRRLIQIGLGIFFMTGMLIAARPVLSLLLRLLGEEWPFRLWTIALFWTILGGILLIPLVAVWRNIGVLAMVYADMTSRGREKGGPIQFLIENGLKLAAGLALFIWLWSFLPLGAAAPWVLAVVLVMATVFLFFFRRRLVYIHSQLEVELEEMLVVRGASSKPLPPWLSQHRDWDLNVNEYELSDAAACSGKRLEEVELRTRSGCSIVAIDRQGFFIGNPGPETRLFPRDRLLLLGSSEEIAAARVLLGSETVQGGQGLEDVRMERILVPADSPAAHKTLGELDIARQTGVQVAAVKRRGRARPQVNPGGNERLKPGDELLVLGSAEQVGRFERWLQRAPEADLSPVAGLD